ncbi:hypothetical protein QJS10_CPB19g00455 [Acorus calamus]|uniref:Reverse transcriptase domain-containing protein n=1 Tax=Acorus calamus TaxID=4465 RepID=A0AAV9CFK0_ACOCL|nr:hypothetical protein QJS10_CPB19g00455 [Acorus calamus]
MGRGLRQGDPLSPYLFTLVAEILSVGFRRKQKQGQLEGYYPDAHIMDPRSGIGLTHMLYADDLLVVARATPKNCHTICSVLKEVHCLTGLNVNWDKSSIRFSPMVPVQFRRWMSRIMHVKPASSKWKYLGVQIFGQDRMPSQKHATVEVADKHLQKWKANLLTQAGRLTLIKAVLQSLPLHSMFAASFPKAVAPHIE